MAVSNFTLLRIRISLGLVPCPTLPLITELHITGGFVITTTTLGKNNASQSTVSLGFLKDDKIVMNNAPIGLKTTGESTKNKGEIPLAAEAGVSPPGDK